VSSGTNNSLYIRLTTGPTSAISTQNQASIASTLRVTIIWGVLGVENRTTVCDPFSAVFLERDWRRGSRIVVIAELEPAARANLI
jgi:hypothetical protein